MSFNPNNQRRVVEDVPQMRSVQIHSAHPVAPPRPFPAALSLAAPKVTAAPTNQISAAWKITQLRPVPTFYKLERTHIKINDCTAQEIAGRIADCLRQESVYATFNDEEVRERLARNSLEHDLTHRTHHDASSVFLTVYRRSRDP